MEGEEAVDAEDSPSMIKMKKRENHLTSQRLSVIIFKMGHFVDECYSDKKKIGKEEKINITEEIEEESVLIMVISDEYGELLIQGPSD